MPDLNLLRVGVVYWQPGDGIAAQISRALERLGYRAIHFLHDAEIPHDLDAMMIWGPMGSLCPLVNQLLARPSSQRPATILLMTEQLPNPALPEWIRYGLGLARSQIERLAYIQQPDGTWRAYSGLSWLLNKAHRFRYYGDLYWLQKQGVLSVLAVTSHWTADFLRLRGFNPITPGLRYDPALGCDLNLDRDIPVLWLGKAATARRRRLLKRLRAELKTRNVEIFMVDGVEHPFVFGKERTILLNRAKIMLNLLRTKWDDNAMRFTLAAHNGALIVTEPVFPHTLYQPGVHIVEASIDQMADTIYYYLNHEQKRQQHVDQAFNFIREYPFDQGIAKMVEKGMKNKINNLGI